MTESRVRIAIVAAFSILASAAAMRADETVAPPPRLPVGTTLLTLPSSQTIGERAWELKFTHRFRQSMTRGSFTDQLHSLFGLDANADVVIGVAWSLRKDLHISLARSNTNDTIEAAAAYAALEQSPRVPVTLTLRGGTDWRTEKNLADRSSFFLQGIVSRQFGRKAEIFLLPTVVSNAGRTVSGDRSSAMFDYAFNVPVAAVVMLNRSLAAVAEVTPPNGDLPEGLNADFGWAVGIKRRLGGHWFEILLTNSQGTTADQYVTSTFQGTGLDSGDVYLGFNIERRFLRRR